VGEPMSETLHDEAAIVKMDGICKNFGAVKALDNVTISLRRGEVLGIVGDNGAGKSTLIKILSGVYQPDKGEIYFEGNKTRFNSPIEARKIGIETIYQDLALIDDLSVYHNIFLAKEQFLTATPVLRFLDNKTMKTDAERFLNDLKVDVPEIDAKARVLSGGQRQAIAIARSVFFSAKVLIMDEPTAALGVVETKRVLDLIENLKKRGDVSIIIIAHNLAHVLAVVDRIVILTRGKIIAERKAKETSVDDLTEIISKGALDITI
jgi:simple sugar transport system ATP-binding protein